MRQGLQGSKHKGSSEHQRVFQDILITRSAGDEGMNDNAGSYPKGCSVVGIATAKGTRVLGKHQRVSLESSGAPSNHLK